MIGPARGAGQTRIALVVGNELYHGALEQLPKAPSDAQKVAAALAKVGFRSLELTEAQAEYNIGRQRLIDEIKAFNLQLSQAEEGSVGVIYFAGHGFARERRGDVYLLPVDSDFHPGVLPEDAGIPLADILLLLRTSKKGRTVVLVIDACRSVIPEEVFAAPPSERGMIVGAGLGGPDGQVGLISRGAAVADGDTTYEGADYFVAFSTSADKAAYDSGLFSKIVSEEIAVGRQDLLTVFKRVGERMASDSMVKSALQLPTYEVGIYGAPPCFGVCPSGGDAERFVDCAGCPWMRVVHKGEFLEGSPPSDEGRGSNEPQQAKQSVDRSFAVGVYEVTRAEWRVCERAGACAALTRKNTWMSDKTPIAGVTAADADAFVAWLSRASGKKYRLPTNTEWEYAARGGANGLFSFGDEVQPSLAAYDYSTTFRGSKKVEYVGTPVATGSFSANQFGLFDVEGNVWEWAGDCAGPSCASLTLRGGSFKSAARELRDANRLKISPNDRREDVGLRVVRDL
jgi:formylglycine-generating enzyme required for sulfatase activity